MRSKEFISRRIRIWSRWATLRRVNGREDLFPRVFPLLFAGSGEKGLRERRPDRRAGSLGPAKRTGTARVPGSRAEGARGGEA